MKFGNISTRLMFYNNMKELIIRLSLCSKSSRKRGTKAVDLHDFLVGIDFLNDGCILFDNAKIHHVV